MSVSLPLDRPKPTAKEPGPASLPKDAEQLFRSARKLESEGSLEAAAELLRRATSLDPTHVRAWLVLGRLLLRQGHSRAAGDALLRVVEQSPQDPEAWLWLGIAQDQSGDSSAAEHAWRRVLALQPSHAGGLLRLGRLLAKRREPEGLEIWRRLGELDPDSIEPPLQLGRLLASTGQLDSAVAAFERVVARAPGHVEADRSIRRIGRLRRDLAEKCAKARQLIKQDRVADGETLLREVLAQAPLFRSALRQLGRLLLRQGRWNEAEDAWVKLRDEASEAVEAGLALAQICRQTERKLEALDHLRGVLRVDPQNLVAKRRLARGLVEAAAWDEAATLLGEIGEQSTGDLWPLLKLGRIRLRQQRWEAAAACFSAALAVDPHDRDALAGRGRAFLAQFRDAAETGEGAGAGEAYRNARRSARGNAGRYASLARRAASERRWEAAAGLWVCSLELREDSSQAWLALGEALLNCGRPAEAETALHIAAGLNPRSSSPLFLLDRVHAAIEGRLEESTSLAARGDAALRGGDRSAAVDLYERAVSLDPNNLVAREGLARLFIERERWADALAQWQAIARCEPGSPLPLLWSARLLNRLGRADEVVEALDRARSLVTDSAADHFAYARTARINEFLSEAEEYFKRAIALAPGNPEYRLGLGDLYRELGYADRAYEVFRTARDQLPSHRRIRERAADIEDLARIYGIPPDSPELRLPERTVERICTIAAAMPDRRVYEPVPRRLVHISSSLAGGGSERQMVNLANGLTQRPDAVESVTLLCEEVTVRPNRAFYLPMVDRSRVGFVEYHSSEVDPATYDEPVFQPFLPFLRHLMPGRRRNAVLRLALELMQLRPEVVHAWQDETTLKAGVAAVIAGVPKIVIRHGSLRPPVRRKRSDRSVENLRPLAECYRALLTLPNVRILNNSRAGADDYADWIGIPPERVDAVYNGVDFAKFDIDPAVRAARRAELGIQDGAPVLGGVFRIMDQKRPLEWLEAAALTLAAVPSARFILAGDGPMSELMRERAREMGLGERMHFLGRVSKVNEWLSAMDVLLSMSMVEGLPNVLIEAQGVGVPVVAYPAGGSAECFIPGKTGWLVTDPTPANMAERVIWTMKHPAWRRAAQPLARRFVRERFGMEQMLDSTLALYGW